MPPETLALALGASIYPPALAAMIALGRGADFRPRVLAFVAAALTVTYAVGLLALLVLGELEIPKRFERVPSGGIDLALGALLILVAIRVRRRPGGPKPEGRSKIDRYLRSRRLAFVLGIVLYTLPSPIYLGAVKTIADAQLSTSGELLTLAVTVAVMLWLVELPMLMILIAPRRASVVLEAINEWFARHGRSLVALACVAAGAYLAVKGVIDISK